MPPSKVQYAHKAAMCVSVSRLSYSGCSTRTSCKKQDQESPTLSVINNNKVTRAALIEWCVSTFAIWSKGGAYGYGPIFPEIICGLYY